MVSIFRKNTALLKSPTVQFGFYCPLELGLSCNQCPMEVGRITVPKINIISINVVLLSVNCATVYYFHRQQLLLPCNCCTNCCKKFASYFCFSLPCRQCYANYNPYQQTSFVFFFFIHSTFWVPIECFN